MNSTSNFLTNATDEYSYLTPSNLLVSYFLFHILLYAFFFFLIKDAYYLDRTIESKFPAFARSDYEHFSLIKSFPFWLTAFPRILLILLSIVTYTIYI